jgi:hypothetical protein
MKTRFNDNDILRFIYDEMSSTESEAFLDALTHDENLWNRYEQFQDTGDRLQEISLEPSEASLQRIMAVVSEEKQADAKSPASPKPLPYLSTALIVSTLLLMLFVGRFGNGLDTQRNAELTQVLDSQASPGLVHEVRMDPGFQENIGWNDQGLEVKLESIKRKAQSLSDDPLL